jgi:6-pyruvoyltetrahydropterin/6-carboxytetrahydropterin synthase
MYEISVEIEFDYAHRLSHYKGKCRNIHGHRGKAIVTVESCELNDEDIVIDFKVIKSSVKEWIDENWDHTLLLNSDDPFIDVFKQIDIRLYLFEGHDPTSEVMARKLYLVCHSMNIPVTRVAIKESPTSEAIYHSN